MRPVLTKGDFYRRYFAGEFGNTGLTWDTAKQAMESGHPGPFAIRVMTPGGRCTYFIPRQDLERVALEYERDGNSPSQLSLSPMAPHRHQGINGELTRNHRGLDLHYSTDRSPMRLSLPKGTWANGLLADQILRQYCQPTDYDWLMGLVDNYPDHAVEFTTFRVPVCEDQLSHMIVWEVRRY